MLPIRRDLVDAMVAHARRDHPDEACGVIAGPEGSDRPERFIPMINAARSPTFYEFDSTEQLKLYREMERERRGAGGDLPLAHRHRGLPVAHRHRPAPPEPDAHYVLVSTRDPDDHELRSYRIVDGEVTEEAVGRRVVLFRTRR